MEPSVAARCAEAVALDPGHRGHRVEGDRVERARVDQLDVAALVFLNTRPRLFGIAYRILRNPVEAEDVVQDAWLRWQTTDRASVINPEAFLVTTTTRLALNDAQCARRRRETLAGPWLPRNRDEASGPEPDAERGEEVADAMLLLLAKLTPSERAAYVLREAIDYPYAADRGCPASRRRELPPAGPPRPAAPRLRTRAAGERDRAQAPP